MVFRYGILAATAAIILLYGLLKPQHNWDMIAYVAASYSKDGYRGSDLTNETYEEIRKEVRGKTFSQLTTGKYRGTVFADPSSLEQQIPFFSIRVGYIELIRLLKKTGLSYAKSTHVISAIFASLSVLVLALIILKTAVPIGMLPIVVAVAGYTELAALSTPDAMACFFSLLGIYSLMTGGRLVFLIAAILPLIRTDFIVLSGLLMSYAYLHHSRFLSLFSILSSILFYILINKLHGNYGYLTLFNFTFIGSLTPYPADIVISHRFSDYLIPYALLLENIIFHSHSVIYVISAYILWVKRDQIKVNVNFYCLLGIPFVFNITHMLLFPTNHYRFLVFSISLILIWSLDLLGQPSKHEKARLFIADNLKS
jgi:hypothetical protein